MIFVLLLIASIIWVYFDARSLGIKHGSNPGSSFDMGPAAWFWSCAILWIVAFPVYLVMRRAPDRRRIADDAVVARTSRPLDELKKIAELKALGAITEYEFASMKAKILNAHEQKGNE